MKRLILILAILLLVGCADKTAVSNKDERGTPRYESVNIISVSTLRDPYGGGGVSVGGFGGSRGSGVGVGIDLGRVFGGSRSSGVVISYEKNGKFYEVSQKGKICEFKKGKATLVNGERIEPNSFCE